VGSNQVRHVDVRVVAATNVDLATRVSEGRFRSDLYYRLNVVPIHIPPLRERKDDIPLLAQHLLARVREQNPHLQVERFSKGAQEAFLRHDWPGNVRELGNVIERAATISTGETIDVEHVASPEPRLNANALPQAMDGLPTLREMEDRYIDHVLASVDDNKVKAAAILGVDPSTLYRRKRRG
jgi:two-component system response regulator HydG